MRNISATETPSLFTPEVFAPVASVPEPASPAPESHSIARDFVHWCWSLDGDFRNSPDLINLRFWMQKSGAAVARSEEDGLLAEARRLYLKRVEQAVRKTETPRDPA